MSDSVYHPWALQFSNSMVTFIKTLHTVIWAVMTTAIFYIGYSVAVMRFGISFYVALVLVVGEILVILFNSWTCPLTNVAAHYTEERSPNFDIFLPRVIAKFNKEIFSVILGMIVVMYVCNSMR